MQYHRLAILATIPMVHVACSRDKAGTSDSINTALATNPPAAKASQPRAPLTNSCEHTGLWAECSIERRLKQAGFVVKKLDEHPGRAGFNVKPLVYSLGSARLEVFVYPDEIAMARDLSLMDTLAVVPAGSTAGWPSSPMLIRSANIAAVLMTQNQRQAERVALAITAGPPQPGSPR